MHVQVLPAHEALDGLILGQAQLVVELSGGAVAVLGPLPELARVVGAGEQRRVLLALVLEDGDALAGHLIRRERNGHLDLIRVPLGPGAAVQPHVAVLQPGAVLEPLQGLEDRRQAHAVRAVRVGEVAGGVDLVGLDALQQIHGDADVLFSERLLLHPAGLVERQVHEVDVLRLHAAVAGAGAGLGPADQRLDLLQFGGVHLPWLLGGHELGHVVLNPLDLLGREPELAAELGHKVSVPHGGVVPHGDVAAGLVCDVHLMALIAQADERAAHGDHVVVGVGGEDHHALGEHAGSVHVGAAAVGPARVGGAAARPAGDGLLQRAEDLDVDVVRAALAGAEQFLQPVLVVVLVGELEDRLLKRAGEPDRGLLGVVRVPLLAEGLHRAQRPRRLEPRQFRRRGRVKDDAAGGVLLQEAGGHLGDHRAFDGALDDARLVLAEGQQHQLAGRENRAHAHGDGLAGHVPLAEEVAGGVHSSDAVKRDQPRAAVAGRTRLVEAHVPGPADAQDLQVQSAGGRDGLLVAVAEIVHVLHRHRAVGDVDVLRPDVDVVEEILPHEAVVTLQRGGVHRPVLVEVERHDVGEAQPFFSMQSNQFLVHALGRAASRQTQHRLLTTRRLGADQFGDLRRHRPARVAAARIHRDRDPFDVAGQGRRADRAAMGAVRAGHAAGAHVGSRVTVGRGGCG